MLGAPLKEKPPGGGFFVACYLRLLGFAAITHLSRAQFAHKPMVVLGKFPHGVFSLARCTPTRPALGHASHHGRHLTQGRCQVGQQSEGNDPQPHPTRQQLPVGPSMNHLVGNHQHGCHHRGKQHAGQGVGTVLGSGAFLASICR